ncbi:hypothetical protein JCM3765_003360 [Sporobolomyces pararoseus]
MPPLGTKLPANRTKKPPSCDHCKQKRVLCHPNPAGCPRCVEKGIECTTTPVVRRKPARRPKGESSVDPGTPSASTSPRASTVDPFDLPVPPATTAGPPTHHSLVSTTAFDPIPSTSAYVHDPVPPPSFDSFQLVSLHYPQSSLSISPELAKHLYVTFAQLPQHEYPIFAAYTLERTLQTLGWQVELLPSHASVLAYCVFAIGALFSFHSSILDPYQLNFGGACPDSFLAVLDHLPDLRKFGKLRAAACQGYREEAFRRARESDILFVASEESASACHILGWLESVSGRQSSAAVWYAAEMSHLRILGRGNSLPSGDVQIRWACYMLIDSIQALLTSENPPQVFSPDECLLVGRTNFCEVQVDRELQGQTEGESGWPNATPHIVLSLKLCRKVSEELAGAWNRDQPFDFANVSAILESLERRKRCATVLVRSVDCTISLKAPSIPRHHFPSYASSDPTTRYQSNQATALRSFRTIIQTSWAYTALVVYRHLRQQQSTHDYSSSTRYLNSRIDFSVNSARHLALEGLAATIDAFDNMAALAAWTHILPSGMERWAQFLVTELNEGLLVMDSKMVDSMAKVSNAMKQNGYAWTSASRDSLIQTLDSNVLAYQLATHAAQDPPVPSTSNSTRQSFSQQQQQQPSFDPTLSLFANITTLSTPSASSSNDQSPPFIATATIPQHSQSPLNNQEPVGMERGGNRMEELSQSLGLGMS